MSICSFWYKAHAQHSGVETKLNIIIMLLRHVIMEAVYTFSSLKLYQMECKINTYADDLMKSNQGKGGKRSIKYSQHKWL